MIDKRVPFSTLSTLFSQVTDDHNQTLSFNKEKQDTFFSFHGVCYFYAPYTLY